MRSLRLLLIGFLFVSSFSTCIQLHTQSSKKLPPYFRQWIDEDVPYIITQEERHEFLKLQTDDQRQRYIEQFWESRNPTPHSSINAFKEEHYRRLAYVRANFGDERYNDGWRTDMGRVYITLGAPQQIGKYHEGISTRPMEIWFYQSPSPALPSYFNLVFYKRSDIDPYTLYSPRSDGPMRVVTNIPNDDKQALHTIDQALGPEVTHAMVSLIPGEPIDIQNPNPTMSSDLLLDQVRNLPEQKLEKQRIERQRMRSQEVVTSNIFTGFNSTELQTVVLHDDRGLSTVHYIVRNQKPDAGLIGTLPDRRIGYDLTLVTHVSTDSGKAIYERKEQLVGVVSPDAAKTGKERKFAAEGRLPLVPGNYAVEATLTNNLTHVSSRTSSRVSVPSSTADTIAISGLMAYRGRPLQTPREQLPFTVAGLRFAPRGEQVVELHAGESLPLVYQLWLPQREKIVSTTPTPTPTAIPTPTPTPTATAPAGKAETVHLHYTLGTVALSGGDPDRLEEDQDVPVTDVDRAGNLVNGHSLDTMNLQQGTYRLVVRATESDSAHSAYATMTVKIVASDQPVEMWSAFGDDQQHPLWQDDLLRGLAAEAMQNNAEATACYRRVLAAKPDAADAQSRLDALTKKTATHTPGE